MLFRIACVVVMALCIPPRTVDAATVNRGFEVAITFPTPVTVGPFSGFVEFDDTLVTPTFTDTFVLGTDAAFLDIQFAFLEMNGVPPFAPRTYTALGGDFDLASLSFVNGDLTRIDFLIDEAPGTIETLISTSNPIVVDVDAALAAVAKFGDLTILPATTTVVPLPAAFPLLATALGFFGLVGWRRRRVLAAT